MSEPRCTDCGGIHYGSVGCPYYRAEPCTTCTRMLKHGEQRKFDLFGRSYHMGCTFLVDPPTNRRSTILARRRHNVKAPFTAEDVPAAHEVGYAEGILAERASQAIKTAEVLSHLQAALVQALPSDDQIIIEHIREAHRLLGGLGRCKYNQTGHLGLHARTLRCDEWEQSSDETRSTLRVTGSGGVATAQFSRQAQDIGNPDYKMCSACGKKHGPHGGVCE